MSLVTPSTAYTITAHFKSHPTKATYIHTEVMAYRVDGVISQLCARHGIERFVCAMAYSRKTGHYWFYGPDEAKAAIKSFKEAKA